LLEEFTNLSAVLKGELLKGSDITIKSQIKKYMRAKMDALGIEYNKEAKEFRFKEEVNIESEG